MDSIPHATALAALSPRARHKLLALAQGCHFAEGEIVFREGEPANYLYILQSGHASLEMYLTGRGTRTLMTVGPGDVFSWSAVLDPHIETASCRAIERIETLRISGAALLEAAQQDTDFGYEFFYALSRVVAGRLLATRVQVLDIFAPS